MEYVELGTLKGDKEANLIKEGAGCPHCKGLLQSNTIHGDPEVTFSCSLCACFFDVSGQLLKRGPHCPSDRDLEMQDLPTSMDERGLRVLKLVVDAIWEEALWMVTLRPLEAEDYHRLRLALHLKKYDEMPEGKLKSFLPRYLPILREALAERMRLDEWMRFLGQPEVVQRLATVQEEIMERLGEEGEG